MKKKNLFLVGLLCCTCTFMYAANSPESKDDRDEEEERSISDPVKIEVQENLWVLHFEKAVGDVSIQIVDTYGAILYEELITIDTPQSIYLPITDDLESCTLIAIGNQINLNIPIYL